MISLRGLFAGPERDFAKAATSKEKAARILKISPEALEAFEEAYRKGAMDDEGGEDPENAKQAARAYSRMIGTTGSVLGGEGGSASENAISRVVAELSAQTPVYVYDGERAYCKRQAAALPDGQEVVSKAEIMAIPEKMRPQLTGSLMKKDMGGDSYPALLMFYRLSKTAKTAAKRQQAYHQFRQGLDILDLDCVTYEILGMNRNSMGHWLPPLVQATMGQDFFRIPKTTLIQVPMPLLQLTRLDYMSLTPSTMHIVDEYCGQVFGLKPDGDYFIRTGTHSSKFDFRNAHVYGPEEVAELGQYLLYNHNAGVMMAGPLCQPSVYGMATTREWCVREFIPDHDQPANPTIYKGLPLRTEIRAFVDMDEKEVIGMAPYWDPALMKQRFGHEEDVDSPHQIHDYIIYSMHEDVLMGRYREAEGRVREELGKILPHLALTGQWSIDIMMNGKDADGKEEFWIIDMALAENSALKGCVPAGLLKRTDEEWIPEIADGTARPAWEGVPGLPGF